MRNSNFRHICTSLLLFTIGCISHPESTTDTGRILVYSTTAINEAASNDGTFNSEISITLSGDEFVDSLASGENYDTLNLPDGLTATVTRLSDTTATLTIAGQTDAGSCGSDNFTFYFDDSAFESGIAPVSFEVPITVTYINPTLTFSRSEMDENVSNIGGFSQNIIITAEDGGTFTQTGVLTEDTDYIWEDLPSGLTPTVTVNSSTQATVTFAGVADAHTPISDIKASFKLTSTVLSDDFCNGFVKKQIDFKFYRSILMYSAGSFNGAMGGRDGMTALCTIQKPKVPSDYDGVAAFISVGPLDQISDLDVPTTVKIESTNSGAVADNWADLLDGSISQALGDASVVTSGNFFWSGSQDDGTVSTGNTCTSWTVTTGNGEIGDSLTTDATWLEADTELCSVANELVCITYVTP